MSVKSIYLSHSVGLLRHVDRGHLPLGRHDVLNASLRPRGFPHTVQ